MADSIDLPLPTEDLVHNDPTIFSKHLEFTGGKIVTRFPPEPNAHLHLGHAKAASLSYGYAERFNGRCIQRLDDTNPESASKEYVNSILESIEWLGFKPHRITYASDYFEELYFYAVKLISDGLAYVCFQTSDEIKEHRRNKLPSPYRDTPIEVNLQLFEAMKNGEFKEGECSLRMKMDITSDNPNMWDLIAYRIKYVPHYRTETTWCVYPSYDFTHAICDSLEHITHSLCTLEFETRRESYYWLLDSLNLYKPYVWEFSRLNLDNSIMSKRKNLKLIQNNIVSDWDDPRLVTLKGLRRRGYTPEIILKFCENIGITRVSNTIISYDLFEETCRAICNTHAPRYFAVKRPLKLIIDNIAPDEVREYERPIFPADSDSPTRPIKLTNTLYIEDTDFRIDDHRKYFGLALNGRNGQNKWVRLRYADLVIRVTSMETDENDKPSVIHCVYDETGEIVKTKTAIHWVSEGFKTDLTFNDYDRLFTVQSPGSLTTDEELRAAYNVNSIEKIDGIVEVGYLDYCNDETNEVPVQFERHGYYVLDRSVIRANSEGVPSELPVVSTDNYTVNRTVPLKVTKTKF
jgi:glutaminyl-tRNA synthetase